jgi:hypothetical protein
MMDNEIRLDHPLPDQVLATMRDMYAPPADVQYWGSLEARIMNGVAHTQRATPHHRTRNWLAVAAAVLIAVGALMARSHREEIRAAYDALFKPTAAETLSTPNGALGSGEGKSGTLRDQITR